RIIDYSKKSLGPVTKHISDSFNLPGGLAGLRLAFVWV
ncbi:hypothetical protein SAMN05720487_12130, partial [Fibrobacter sp. UWT2]